MPLKIGITGATSTGKSTLLKDLAEELRLPTITELIRNVAKQFGMNLEELRSNQVVLSYFQWSCLITQINTEYDLEQTGFITDRTTLDNWMYWKIYNSKYWSPEVNNTYFDMCQRHSSKYDLIIFTDPVGVPFEDDGWRQATGESRMNESDEARKIVIGSLAKSKMTVTGDRVRRVRQVINQLDRSIERI